MRHNKQAPVSVIIPCYRCATTIRRAINSVYCQTKKPIEVILVDDASGDDTLRGLRALEVQYTGWIKVISLPVNSGAASARNLGWEIATQPYIAFLDSDDAWHPQKIEIQYNYMKENSSVVLSGHGHRVLQESNEQLDWDISFSDAEAISKFQLLLSNRFVTPSIMLRRDIKQRFIEQQRHMEDHMLWLQIICDGALVTRSPTELAAIYKSSFGVTGLSADLWSMEWGDLRNYHTLYQNNNINAYQLALLQMFSVLKYLRRIVVYWGCLRWKNKKNIF
jgi:glycosyltransferase involved in cell wall biosynthesis